MLFINDVVFKVFDPSHTIKTIEVVCTRNNVDKVVKELDLVLIKSTPNKVFEFVTKKGGTDCIVHIADNNLGLTALLKGSLANDKEIKLLPLMYQRDMSESYTCCPNKNVKTWLQHVLYIKLLDKILPEKHLSKRNYTSLLTQFNKTREEVYIDFKPWNNDFSKAELITLSCVNDFPVLPDFLRGKQFLMHTFLSADYSRKVIASLEYIYIECLNKHIYAALKRNERLTFTDIDNYLYKTMMEISTSLENKTMANFVRNNLYYLVDKTTPQFYLNFKRYYDVIQKRKLKNSK